MIRFFTGLFGLMSGFSACCFAYLGLVYVTIGQGLHPALALVLTMSACLVGGMLMAKATSKIL